MHAFLCFFIANYKQDKHWAKEVTLGIKAANAAGGLPDPTSLLSFQMFLPL